MQTLTNTCHICKEDFGSWFDYQEHMSFGTHKPVEVIAPIDAKEHEGIAFTEECKEVIPAELKVFSSGRADLARREYPGPMPEMKKRLVVARGEQRLGLQHFVGFALVLLALTMPVLADDDDRPTYRPIGMTGVSGQDATVHTQYGIEGAIRLYDHKYFQLQVFDALSTQHNLFIGGRALLKIGKSYEERRLDDLEKKLKEYSRIQSTLIVSDTEHGK
jgi:hypothetical protein